MNESTNVQAMFSDATVDVLRVFPGAKALKKPLFCNPCDKALIAQYECLYQSAPVADLVALLNKRRGVIVPRTWPDGRREWACHVCGRSCTATKAKMTVMTISRWERQVNVVFYFGFLLRQEILGL